jgi:hypothetical protein
MHTGAVWNRTFSGTSDPCPIPATFRVLSQRERDTFGVAGVFARDPEAFGTLSPHDQDCAVYRLLRHAGVVRTDERRPELDAAGRVRTSWGVTTGTPGRPRARGGAAARTASTRTWRMP